MTDMRGRRGRPWRRLQAQVYATESHCHLCGEWVNPALPSRHRLARSVDHLIPLSQGGEALDRYNARLAHIGCNARKGTGRRATVTPHTPTTW